MLTLLAAVILAAVQIGGSFGEAEATTVSINESSMVVSLSVEVPQEAQAVVVHMGLEGETMVFGMLPGPTPGLWVITREVARKNWQVAFEFIGPVSEISPAMTLGFLGADLSLDLPDPGDPGGEPDDGLSRETQRWGYLGIALAAASLSLLAFWVLGGESRDIKEAGTEEE